MATLPLLYRKILRDYVLSLFATEFDAVSNQSAKAYGTDPVVIDFTAGSANFLVSYVSPDDVEDCGFQWGDGVNVAGCMYTGGAKDTGIPRGFRFAGLVDLHIDWYIRKREGVEGFDTESQLDAIEDAADAIIVDPANQWPAGFNLSRKSDFTRQPNVPLGDGYATRIPMKFLFEVKVP